MTRQEVVNLAVALLVPIVTAALGVLGLVFGDWRQRRTEAGRRKLALEDARRQVSFASEWWNARKLLANSPEAVQEATIRAAAWLEEAYALVAESKPPPVEERQPITLRRLLVLYPLQSRAANVIRGLYYICLGWLLVWVGEMLNDIFVPELTNKYLYGSIVTVSASAVLALGLRFWIERVERERAKRGRARRLSLRRALLFYRLHRPAARIVRAIFYIYALFLAFALVILVWGGWDDPHYAPGHTVYSFVLIGYAVALRYWAASLETGRQGGEASRVVSTAQS